MRRINWPHMYVTVTTTAIMNPRMCVCLFSDIILIKNEFARKREISRFKGTQYTGTTTASLLQ